MSLDHALGRSGSEVTTEIRAIRLMVAEAKRGSSGTPRYVEHVLLDAYQADEEPERIARLHRTLGWAVALASRDCNNRFLGKLARLHDHKGDLTATWSVPPSDTERAYLDSAWLDGRVGDGGNPAHHEVE